MKQISNVGYKEAGYIHLKISILSEDNDLKLVLYLPNDLTIPEVLTPKKYTDVWKDKLTTWYKAESDKIETTFLKDFQEIFDKSIYDTKILNKLMTINFSNDENLFVTISKKEKDFSLCIPWELLIGGPCYAKRPLIIHESNSPTISIKPFKSHYGYIYSNVKKLKTVKVIEDQISGEIERYTPNIRIATVGTNRRAKPNRLYKEQDTCDSRFFYFHIRNRLMPKHPFSPKELQDNPAHTRTCAIIPFSDEKPNADNWTPTNSLEFAHAANRYCRFPLLGVSLLKPVNIESCGKITVAIADAIQNNRTIEGTVKHIVEFLYESSRVLNLLVLSGCLESDPMRNLAMALSNGSQNKQQHNKDDIAYFISKNQFKLAIDKLEELGESEANVSLLRSQLEEINSDRLAKMNVEEKEGVLKRAILIARDNLITIV